jgi:hypothetical protein
MTFPVKVKADAVSTTRRPVTQTALAEVKKASTGWMPCVVAFGSINKNPPIIIKLPKLATNNRAGFTPRR